ncbi:hypothetical protein ACFY9C_22840 [Streptomyces filamentosus]|uniref:hypothetical protein n=1 Tax=Streptomyces filamentosus TaxID=67294 RepID=UPI0033F2612D
MKKRTLVLSSLGGALLAAGGATGLAFYEAAHVEPTFCFCSYGRDSAAHVAGDAHLLVAGTVREARAYRRPDPSGREERGVRARVVLDSAYKYAVPDAHGLAPGSVVDVERTAGLHEEFWDPLAEGRRYTLSLFPTADGAGAAYAAEAVAEEPRRAAGDARWRLAAGDAERLPDACDGQRRAHAEEYGADDVLREWLS